MAHLLGYTREISEPELKKYQYYRQGDNIGKKGLEKSTRTISGVSQAFNLLP